MNTELELLKNESEWEDSESANAGKIRTVERKTSIQVTKAQDSGYQHNMVRDGGNILENHRFALRLLGAALIGWLAWRGEVAALALLPVMVWLWRDSRNRLDAFGVIFTYYLTAGRGLLPGACVFFSNSLTPPVWWVGVLVWTLPSALLATAWAACWSTKHRGLRLLLALALISLPPIGVIGWANPLTATGALFPNTSWLGLGLTLILFVLIAEQPRSHFIAPLLSLALTLNIFQPPKPPAPGWIGLDTQHLPSSSTEGEFERMQSLQQLVTRKSRDAASGTVFLLPEAVGGNWAINEGWWRRVSARLTEKKQTVIIGATRPATDGGRYVNILTTIGHGSGTEFIDRVPVPFGMWKPHRPDGASAFWWDTGVAEFNGIRVASLICYEQLLAWPIIVSMAQAPALIIAASNDWWARGTSIPDIQRQVVTAWGRLFGVPTVYAANL